MSHFEDNLSQVIVEEKRRERNILRNVYLWMTLGLVITATVAFIVPGMPGLFLTIQSNPFLLIGLLVVQVAIVVFLSARINKMSAATAIFAFVFYAALTGVTFAIILTAYRYNTIFKAFAATAAMFLITGAFGVFTKRDLTKMGHFVIMAVVGIIAASLINVFLRSAALDYGISIIGVIAFTGLTAYDTQKIAKMSREMSSSVDEERYMKLSVMGALKLYLDFINIFLFLLRILRRR